MTVQEILAVYRTQSYSERHKGERFERLMQAFLRTSPLYSNLFKQVWMWEDFPARQDFGGKDIGIDLVAETVDGDFWAVQCKCYADDTWVTKPMVDSFLATSCKMFQMPDADEKTGFAHRLWIATTDRWNAEAETIISDTQPPVTRILLNDLENSGVDWQKLYDGQSGNQALQQPKKVREHQHLAIEKFNQHFQTQDRGKLIMACGTGKTFTALKIMEQQTNGKGLALFLVPSIALLNQALIAWMTDAAEPIFPICVCSDAKASRKRMRQDDSDDMAVIDLARPATTDVNSIVQQLHQARETGGLTVVFATYQSIDVVSKAQAILNKSTPGSCVFDLIVCDEAHRTTGVTLKDADESAFVKVHDNDFLPAAKRLYMTATPRLYTEDSKSKAKEAEAILCSMDDPAIYGDEVYRIGFGEAVKKELLSDYKVLVLTVSDRDIPPSLQMSIANGEMEINTDDAAKLVGCISALSKRMLVDEELLKGPDPEPMRSAVAFCSTIKASKQIAGLFEDFGQKYYDALDDETKAEVVRIDTDHVDGSMAATERSAKLQWLASVNRDAQHCHILHNVRCLSEGVDVPSLDAVLFLSPRNSQVDVVQSVGRVMRRAPGKKYGYIIIPVVIPSDVPPDEALDDNERFKVVWSVLNALRAHDDRFNAMVNKIELNKKTRPDKVIVAPPGSAGGEGDGDEPAAPGQLELPYVQGLQNAIYARMVEKVGSRRYWEQWASDVADIAKRHIERITKLVAQSPEHRQAFADFLAGLRKNINPSVTEDEAIEMLAQHIITKPVFEALFEDYSFVRNNPVSIAMQNMLDLLEDTAMEKDQETLEKFYASVQERASGIDNAEGRQRVIVELYDKFFKTAFPMTVEKLGIVYTPVEVVDFIVRSVADVLRQEFGRELSDENIHILDPFTGTGTFITRLLQCGLITPEALEHKYSCEIHANEIVLLAYYIASINIENTFHDLRDDGQGDYVPFNGICLTDTFQLGENDDSEALFSEMFSKNSERVMAQQKAPLRIIMGNPPYSVGQKSANDNAQNMSYPKLEKRIADTYAKWSKASSVKALYDSYIKAFRWASDRLDPENGGIIAFVSNSGWLEGNGMDGFRKNLEEEFSAVYVFDLRGN
ncbi:MAG: DEAD/DEAH box helicase, partial [Lentisphaerae bacterium]|nr:DEAD/DEAH box helicase [Lentisphaerota bacterium]